MAQPSENFEYIWHSLAKEQIDKEPNPVVTKYKRSEVDTKYDENGLRIEHRLVTMKNGTVYPVLSSHLDRRVPNGLYGLTHAEGVGWTTRPEGLYVEREKFLGALSLQGIVIGIPQNRGKFVGYDEYVDDFMSIVLREAEEHGNDPQAILLSGLSQSAMLAMGIIVRGSSVHNVKTLSAHAAVPCLPDGVKLKDWKHLPGQLYETFSNIPHELKAGIRIAQMDPEKRKAIVPTADLSWSALYTQPQMLPSLLSGKSGEYAKQLPDDISIYVELKGRDMLSRAKRWNSDTYLGNKPSVRVDFDSRGSHANVVDEVSQSNWNEFQAANIQLLREHPAIRSNMATAAHNLLALTATHFPQYVKQPHIPIHETA